MTYRNSCRNICLNPDTMVLSAECSLPDGTCRASQLDLSKSIKCTKASSVEGLALIDGSEERFVRLTEEQPSNLQKVHLGDGRYFRAWVRYQNRVSDNLIKGLFDNNWYWKWAQIDLDEHVRNNLGTLEFVMDKPRTWRDVVPAFVAQALTEERMDWAAKKVFFAARTKGMDMAYSDMTTSDALWGTGEHLEKLRQEQMEREKAWYEGSYVQGGKFIRSGN
ncbi:hypothetical protein DL546_000527 [Coniochaeta pulveracea]|uniref:Cyanovirin-N domain-containing protein n=1 Tax=Coniochaeta pulveracea TaxID=177199 RepID=A0A420XZN1_9PEZI|nr:hypothetical protein DL546_000527 [Coniochaeta pulveracea]